MSKRLQVVLPDEQYDAVTAAARRRGVTIAAWVRDLLRVACGRAPRGSAERKIAVIRTACEHGFPIADIEDLLAQIESGYGSEPE